MPRKYLTIDKDDVDSMRAKGKKWKAIADELGVLVSKLRDWRQEEGYEDTALMTVDDAHLDSVVAPFSAEHPNTGEVMLQGYMLSEGYKVTWTQLRNSILRVDAEGRERRRTKIKPIPRRDYDVVTPNELWYAD